jgi:hypothetical protein
MRRKVKTITGAEGRAVGKEESKGGGGKTERTQGHCKDHFASVV